MSNELKLRVLFDTVDRLTKPMKAMLNGNRDLSTALKQSRDQLKALGKTQKEVATFREMRAGLADTAAKLGGAQTHVKALAGALRATGAPTKQMMADFERAKQAAAQLGHAHEKQSAQLQTLRGRLSSAGIQTRNLSQHERELRGNMAATTRAMTEQQAKLSALAAREKKINDARAKMNALQGTAANMAVSGYAARSTGMHLLGGLGGTLGESKHVENEALRIRALGLSASSADGAIGYAKAMRARGVSTADNLTLMRDATSIFGDSEHAKMVMPTLAKMKFANEATFGGEDAQANEEKFMNMLKVIELRGGTKDQATFKDEANMVQKVLTATGGRVGGDEWRNFIQTGGVAAKQMRKDAFYYQMEPLIQEMGGHAVGTGLMSAYSGMYQGKTTVRAAKQMMDLGLLDKKKVEYNKIGMIKQIKPGGLLGGDLFKASPLEWLEKVLLPKLAAKGITDPDQVKDMIGTIMTNRTAANLFTTMYMQRQQIHKNERLNAGADGINALSDKAQDSTQGRELAALARLHDLKLQIGEKVSPLYNQGLALTAKLTEQILGFMERHSQAATVILTLVAALGALLVVAGTLTIALAGILGPLAILKFSMTTLGIQGGILTRVLGLGVSALRLLGSVLMFVGRAFLMNPIGLAITGIALGAYLIYRYWEPIKAFFGGLWDEVRAAFAGGILAVGTLLMNWSPLGLFYRALAGVLGWFGIELPAKFSEFGGNLVTGLVNGILSGLGTVKDAITQVASSTVGWFKDKLGIHSPSRVFGELGGFIGQGAALGIAGSQAHVIQAAAGLATAATMAFAAPGTATAALISPSAPFAARNLSLDTRAPLAARPANGNPAASAAPSQYVFHIQGTDAKDIARQVRSTIEQIERDKQSRLGSRLTDKTY